MRGDIGKYNLVEAFDGLMDHFSIPGGTSPPHNAFEISNLNEPFAPDRGYLRSPQLGNQRSLVQEESLPVGYGSA